MSMNIDRHIKAHRELYENLANGEAVKAAQTKAFYDEYFAVLDLTAEFYLETVRLVFQEHTLPSGMLTYQNCKVEPRAIRRTTLFTVEGEKGRYLRSRTDVGGARSLLVAATLSQTPPHAGRRGPLRCVFRQELAAADLSDGEEHYFAKRLNARTASSPECTQDCAHPLGAQVSDGVESRSSASRSSQSTRLEDTILPVRLSKRRSSQRPFLLVSTTIDATRCAASPPLEGDKGAIAAFLACRSAEK